MFTTARAMLVLGIRCRVVANVIDIFGALC